MVSSRSARLLIGIVLTFGLAIGGCGSSSSLDGTYHQAGGAGVVTLEFKPAR